MGPNVSRISEITRQWKLNIAEAYATEAREISSTGSSEESFYREFFSQAGAPNQYRTRERSIAKFLIGIDGAKRVKAYGHNDYVFNIPEDRCMHAEEAIMEEASLRDASMSLASLHFAKDLDRKYRAAVAFLSAMKVFNNIDNTVVIEDFGRDEFVVIIPGNEEEFARGMVQKSFPVKPEGRF